MGSPLRWQNLNCCSSVIALQANGGIGPCEKWWKPRLFDLSIRSQWYTNITIALHIYIYRPKLLEMRFVFYSYVSFLWLSIKPFLFFAPTFHFVSFTTPRSDYTLICIAWWSPSSVFRCSNDQRGTKTTRTRWHNRYIHTDARTHSLENSSLWDLLSCDGSHI